MMRLQRYAFAGRDESPPDPHPGGMPPAAAVAALPGRTLVPSRRRQNTVAVIRIARFWSADSATSATPSAARVAAVGPTILDGLDAFGSEAPEVPPSPAPAAPQPAPARRRSRRGVWLTCAVLLAAGASFWYWQNAIGGRGMASLTLETSPAAAVAALDGRPIGSTPLTISLAPGAYDVRLTLEDGQTRDLRVHLSPGMSLVRQVELPPVPPVAVPNSGALHVQTDLSRAMVSVDGVERGPAPVIVPDLSPGEHSVALVADGATVRRTVMVEAGRTVSLVVPASPRPAVVPGWLSVQSPIPMQLREDGALIGTTEAQRLMLASGDHEIEVVNDRLAYRSAHRVTIAPGRTAVLAIELPRGTMSLNALPWAEVFVDGERIGETPIANLSRPIGPHEVVFRHPQYGERRETVLVTAAQPARLGIDLRRGSR
jgi:hypothetical protein